jgi:hypothetical protein
VASLCGISRQSVYSRIVNGGWKRLTDALKLSRASGIPVEKFAGQTIGSKPPLRKGNEHGEGDRILA